MSIASLDKSIYYCLILYALLSCITIAGTNIAVSLALILTIIRYSKEPIRLNIDKGLVRAILLYLAAAFLSAVFAYYPTIGLNKTVNYLYRMLPLFLAIAFIKNKRQFFQIIVTMAISLTLADIAAIWQGLHGNLRAHGFSANAMILAGFLLQMMPVLLVISLKADFLPSKYRAVFFAVFVLSCVALIYNGTRGAWLAIGVTIPLGLLGMNINKKIATGMIFILLISSLLLLQIPFINDRVHSIADMKSNAERLLLWQSAWNMFTDHPVMGIGTGNFDNLYSSRYMLPGAREELGNAHNVFLNALAENGVVGFIFFTYLFGYILYQSIQKMKNSPYQIWGITACLFTLSLLIQGLTQCNFVDSAVIRMYWFLLGIMQAAYNLEQLEESEYV